MASSLLFRFLQKCFIYCWWIRRFSWWIRRIHGDSGDVFDSGEVLLMIPARFWWFRWCCWWSRWFWWIRRFCWRCCWWIRRIHDFPARFFDYSGEGLLDLGFWFGWERNVWMREKVRWQIRWMQIFCFVFIKILDFTILPLFVIFGCISAIRWRGIGWLGFDYMYFRY